LNQLLNAGLKVSSPGEGDFTNGELTIEVGGKGKNTSLVKHPDNYLIAADDIDTGGKQSSFLVIWVFILNELL